MERINVRVMAEAYEGQIKPIEVILEDQRIAIKKILSAQPIKSRKDYSQDIGMRFIVRSDHRDFILIFDGRWWVEIN